MACAPFRAEDISQPGSDENHRTLAVWEESHQKCPASDIPHDPFQHLVAGNPIPLFTGETHVRQRLLDGIFKILASSRKTHRTEFLSDSYHFLTNRSEVPLGVR